MSIIKKTPYIETKIKAYSETTLTNLLLELNTSTPTLDADWRNLPESLVATCLFKFSDGYKTGILVRENLKTTIFLAYDTAEQTIAIYELDLGKEIKKEIREYLTISELRRVIYETKDTASAGTPFSIVEVTGLSGTLSDDDYASISGDNCVIKVGTQLYYKAFDASTLIVYQAFSRTNSDNALYDYIEITKSTKGFEVKADYIVEGNPTGNATDPLTKLKIGTTIFSIPDGVIFKYIGTTTTALTDGDTTNPITIGGESVTAEAGNVVFYNDNEFVFDGASWEQFGSVGFANPMTTQGDLIVGGSSGIPERMGKGNTGELLGSNASGVAWTNALPFITTAPSANNTNGLIIVVLSSEPATKYSGYLYLITE